MTTQDDPRAKVNVPDLIAAKRAGRRITMLTAYDAAFAKLVDAAGIDSILVGDSLGMVVLGHATTVPVTMDDMVSHCAAVARGASRPLLVGDLPFGSYQAGVADAMRNAARLLKEGGMDAVKLEGGREVAETVRALTDNGIAVMAHVGLTPQRVAQLGGYKVQAKTGRAAQRLLDDALALEEAGAFAIVLEAIPAQVAALVTERLAIPTVGIGAGVQCDGQVLVLHDALGLYGSFAPKFAKRYADLGPVIVGALRDYDREVREGTSPDEAHSFAMSEREAANLDRSVTATTPRAVATPRAV